MPKNKKAAIFLERKLYLSTAFLSLGKNSVKIIIAFLDKKENNLEEAVSLSYKFLQKRYKIHQESVRRSFNELISKGFLSVKHQGGTGQYNKNLYVWSENYLNWEKGMSFALPKRKQVHLKERKKINNALRYQVMKRDSFYCQLCGITGKKVLLVVDHKVPVSRGGKTEMKNLQTLCQKCNTGKRDDV